MTTTPIAYRFAAAIVLCMVALAVMVPVAMIVMVDPDHVFHPPLSWLPEHRFRNEPWVQNAGLINSYLAVDDSPFDAVIVGSSVSQNFRPYMLAGHDGRGQVMKLALAGAGPMAQKVLLLRALAAGRVKHVYWEILSTQYATADETGRSQQPASYGSEDFGEDKAYLYNDSRLDDYRYVFNSHSLYAAIALLAGKDAEYVLPMELVGNWADSCRRDGSCPQGNYFRPEAFEALRASYVKRVRHYDSLLAARNTALYGLLDVALLDVVRAQCGGARSFDLYFPPVSIMTYANMSERDFGYHFFMLRYLLEQVGHCGNVRIFAFGDDGRLTGNMANYSDVVHFLPWISDYVAESFISGNHRITRENIDTYERAMIAAINDYYPYANLRE